MRGEAYFYVNSRTIESLSDLITVALSVSRRMKAILSVAAELCHSPIAAIILLDATSQQCGIPPGIELSDIPFDQSFCAHTISCPDRALVVTDASLDCRFRSNPYVTGDPKIRFFAGTAIEDERGRPLGSLGVIDCESRTVSDNALKGLRSLASTVSDALRLDGFERRWGPAQSMAALSEQADHFRLHSMLVGVVEPSGRTLMLIDIDRFRDINSAFGHGSGDDILVEVANRLADAPLPPISQSYRLGADDFCIIVHQPLSNREAAALAADVHRLIAAPFFIKGAKVSLASSIGVSATEVRTWSDHFNAADTALYLAKRAGGNQYRLAEADLPLLCHPAAVRASAGFARDCAAVVSLAA